MHIISRKALREFSKRHPDSDTPLDTWYRIIRSNRFETFVELRRFFPSADKVGNLIVFNIGGNKYRLITSVHFSRQKVYVRHILTHEEYNQERWKQ